VVVLLERQWVCRAHQHEPSALDFFIIFGPPANEVVTTMYTARSALLAPRSFFSCEVGQDEQERRFKARIDDPIRQWKLSQLDIESFQRWYAYSRERVT
jgi:hypothetical protein